MTEPTAQLTAAEAMAIDAISGTAAPPAAPEAGADVRIEPQIALTSHAPSDSTAVEADAHHLKEPPEAEISTEEDDADMLAMRSAMLDSAELANRAAGMAAKAATDMHGASASLIASHSTQRLHGIVVLATFGALMLTSMALFGIMSYRLQSRIAQADAMLLAVGKRIVSMDESMELITGAGETLRDIASRQDSIIGGQMKLDARLDEIVMANQAVTQAASKPADTKGPDLAKLIQALDAKLQSQSAALNALSSQVRTAPAPRPDPAVVRHEIEAALRQQKAAEAASKPVVVAPPAPAAPPPKPKETLVQYPRAQPQGKSGDAP